MDVQILHLTRFNKKILKFKKLFLGVTTSCKQLEQLTKNLCNNKDLARWQASQQL